MSVLAVAGAAAAWKRFPRAARFASALLTLQVAAVFLSGALWLSHQLVLARYLLVALPLLLLAVALGFDAACTTLLAPRARPLAWLGAAALLAAGFFTGPLPRALAYPNAFFSNYLYWVDYDPAHNHKYRHDPNGHGGNRRDGGRDFRKPRENGAEGAPRPEARDDKNRRFEGKDRDNKDRDRNKGKFGGDRDKGRDNRGRDRDKGRDRQGGPSLRPYASSATPRACALMPYQCQIFPAACKFRPVARTNPSASSAPPYRAPALTCPPLASNFAARKRSR